MGLKQDRETIFRKLDERFRRLYAYTTGTVFADPSVFVDPETKPSGERSAFDSYHYHYYKDRIGEHAVRNARDQMIWNHLNMKIAKGGVPVLYIPTAITGGILAHQLSVEVDHRVPVMIGKQKVLLRTTKDLDKSAAGSERVLKDVVQPNEREAMTRREYHRKKFPEYNLQYPYDKEGAVRMNRADTDSSFGRQPEEEDFMGGWYTEEDDDECKGIVYERDIPFSRNSNWETMRAIRNAIGKNNGMTRHEADYNIFKGDRSHVPLAEIVQANIEYLFYALENEFYAPEAATCLAWTLEIDRRLRDPAYNAQSYDPIDLDAIAPGIAAEYASGDEWAVKARAKMDALRPAAEKLLHRHFVHHIPERFMRELDDGHRAARANPPGIELQDKKWGEAAARPVPKTLDELLTQAGLEPADPLIAGIKSRIGKLENYRLIGRDERSEALPDSLRRIATPHFEGRSEIASRGLHRIASPKQISHKEDIFDAQKFGTRIFDRDYFSRVKSSREKLALRMAIGAMMTISPPYGRPGWTFISSDLKKGEFGEQALGKIKGVHDIRLLESAYNDHDRFVDEVVIPGIRKCLEIIEDERAQQKEANGIAGPVISSLNTDVELPMAFAALKELTAVDGPPEFSSEAKMALRIAIIDLMADTFRVVDAGWANSDKQVNHMVRATLVQLGLARRGTMDSYNIVIKDHEGSEMDLYDRLKPICDYLEHCVNKGVKASEQAWAAAVMLQLHEMLIDPGYNVDRNGKTAIDYNDVHESFYEYRTTGQRYAMDRLINGDPAGTTELERKGARRFILEHCVDKDWFDYHEIRKDIDSDYYWSWTKNTGQKDFRSAPDSPSHRMGVRGGPS